jgi:hypothetical protein
LFEPVIKLDVDLELHAECSVRKKEARVGA